jgi:hypothetical protein
MMFTTTENAKLSNTVSFSSYSVQTKEEELQQKEREKVAVEEAVRRQN